MTADALLAAAAQVWPEPASVRVASRSPRAARPTSSTRSFLLLPSARDPRLAVPASSSRAAATAAASASAPGSFRASVRAGAIAALLRTPVAGRLLPGRLLVELPPGAAGLDDHLADVLGREVAVGLRVGPPRANRKAVLQVVSPDGTLLAYAKLGNGALTDALVDTEAAALTRLAQLTSRVVTVPGVIHHGTWDGHALLVQSPLPVPRSVGLRGVRPATLVRAMSEVMATGEPGVAPLESLPWWERTTARADALPPDSTADALLAARHALAREGERVLGHGAWHGDWNPGNCAPSGQRLLVWDWERYETGVPAGFDALHMALTDRLRSPGDAAAAARSTVQNAATLLAPFRVRAADAQLVVALYLWGLGVRYAGDGQAQAGAAVGRLAEWLLPVLEEVVGATHTVTGVARDGGEA